MVFPSGRRGQRWATGKASTFAGEPLSDLRFSCFCPWCLFSCFAWHVAQPGASHHPQHFPSAGGRRWHRKDGWSGHRGRPEATGDGHCMFQAKHSTSEESRGNRMQIFSLFIDNLPIDLDSLGLKKLFNSFGKVVDVYIPNKFGRKSGRKYRFIRFGEFNHGKSAIEALNGEFVNGHKLEVAWAKFQKRTSSRPSKQREEPQKKMVWKWILKKKLTSLPNEAPKALENNPHISKHF